MRGILRIWGGLPISGVLGLLLAYGSYNGGLHAQDEDDSASTSKRIEAEQKKQTDGNQHDNGERENQGDTPRGGVSEDFYQVIVEYNLFHPLGWSKPDRELEYSLIGTLIESNGPIAKAFLLERRSNQYYSVAVGDKVGEAIIEGIKPSEVSLDRDGETVTLRCDSNRFLHVADSSGHAKKSSGEGSKHASSDEKDEGEKIKSPDDRSSDRDKMRNIRNQFRNASPEERQRMIQEFRRRGGGRRSRGDGGHSRGDGGRSRARAGEAVHMRGR